MALVFLDWKEGHYLRNQRSSLVALVLAACMLLLLHGSNAAAQARPNGAFVDAQTIEGSSDRICSFYRKRGKTSVLLSRIDGGKLFKKKYWDSRSLKAKVSEVSGTVKSLGRQFSKSAKSKRKKAKRQLADLKAAQRQIAACVRQRSQSEEPAPVRFEHVQPLIQRHCMTCHGALGWQNSEEFFRESGRVVPGDLEASPFYTFLSNNPEGFLPAYMPKGLPSLSEANLLLMARWISGPANGQGPPATPTPGGEIGMGRLAYMTNCSACHGGIDVSAKWGRSAAQIRAAMNSVPQMLHLRLSDEQLQRIALALSQVQPPQLGTVFVRSLGSTVEGNPGGTARFLRFEIKFSGQTSQPFNVGYVTSNGTAFAGSDFEFAASSVTFAGYDQETHIVSIPVYGDSTYESDESMFLDIGGVSHGGVRVSVSTASALIINDDTFVINPPPAFESVRLAYGFNSGWSDSIGVSHAEPSSSMTVTTAARVGSGAALFDTASDFLLVPGTNLSGLSSFTFASWVYWDNSSSTNTRIFDFGSSTSNYIYFMPRDGSNRCRFELRGAGTSTFALQCNSGVALPAGRWVHVAVTWNGASDEMKIFFDGNQVASRSVTADPSSISFSDNRLGLGRNSGAIPFAGRLDETMVWDAALTQAQLTQLMAMSSSATFTSGLEVRLGSQVLANGSELNFGQLLTGEIDTRTIFVQAHGPGGIALLSTPLVRVVGPQADQFSVHVQPMPWQEILSPGTLASFVIRYSPTVSGSKQSTLALTNADPVQGGYALTLRGSATGDPVRSGEGIAGSGGDPVLDEGRALYAVNCASCHRPLAVSQKLGVSLSQVTAALNPVSGIPQMRALGLSGEQVQRIVLALNSPVPASDRAPVAGNYVVNVGTAPYVASVLADIFLPPDPGSYTPADTAIWTSISEGVQGMRLNGTYITGRAMFFQQRRQRFDHRFQAEEAQNTLRPVPDTVRAGLLNRVCDLVTESDQAVSNALGKIALTTSSPITPQSIKDIYEKLFSPGRELPMYVAESLSTFPNGALFMTATDKWRFILNNLCSSGITEGI